MKIKVDAISIKLNASRNHQNLVESKPVTDLNLRMKREPTSCARLKREGNSRRELAPLKIFNHLFFLKLSSLLFYSLAVLSLIVLSLFNVNAQDDEVIKIETELVPFEIVVTGSDGKPVRGLELKDFKLFEDGSERNIDFFQPIVKSDSSRPLSIVFALDVSGSITPEELMKLRNAMQTFVQKLADYNSYFAVTTFGMSVKKIQTFTNNPRKLEKSFEKILRDLEGLSTHAYDAADYGIRMLQKDSPATIGNKIPKRAVILITDGFPVGDTVSPATVIERANAAATTVYSVILPSYSRMQMGKKPVLTLLEASGLIEKTGGRTFYATPQDFEPLFALLAEEITSSYLLAFYPNPASKSSGKPHRVKIEGPDGLVIKQNRPGYEIKSKSDQ